MKKTAPNQNPSAKQRKKQRQIKTLARNKSAKRHPLSPPYLFPSGPPKHHRRAALSSSGQRVAALLPGRHPLRTSPPPRLPPSPAPPFIPALPPSSPAATAPPPSATLPSTAPPPRAASFVPAPPLLSGRHPPRASPPPRPPPSPRRPLPPRASPPPRAAPFIPAPPLLSGHCLLPSPRRHLRLRRGTASPSPTARFVFPHAATFSLLRATASPSPPTPSANPPVFPGRPPSPSRPAPCAAPAAAPSRPGWERGRKCSTRHRRRLLGFVSRASRRAGGGGVLLICFVLTNIEDGKTYNLVMYVKSAGAAELTVSLTSSDGLQNLASAIVPVAGTSNWTKVEQKLIANGTNRTSRLQITTNKKGVIWFDQVSLMPSDTYKGHGFRTELISMILDLKPQFLRFPGGSFVEGDWLRNAFRWRETIGPWEERPGHFGDVWHYWTDDGLGYYEFLQLAEDLGAAPIWVFNNGISHNDEVNTATVAPFVKDVLDSLEFARGSAESVLLVNQEFGQIGVTLHP